MTAGAVPRATLRAPLPDSNLAPTPMPITIKVNKNGPYVIQEADIPQVTLVDHEGNVIPTAGKKRISLCRCGASSTKPFCDGTHSRIGFIGAEIAREEFDRASGAGAGAAPTTAEAAGRPDPQRGSGEGTGGRTGS